MPEGLDYIPACVLELKAEVEAAGPYGLDYHEITGCQTGEGCWQSAYLSICRLDTGESLVLLSGHPGQIEEMVAEARRAWLEGRKVLLRGGHA